MTTGEVANEITSGGLAENANIETGSGHTTDRAVVSSKKDIDRFEVESSELTSGEREHPLPRSGARANDCDVLMAKSRGAQASALFDPEAMALLETLAKKPSFDFSELAEEVQTPVKWVKLAVLVRAYLVEPLDNGVRVTLEGSQALERVSSLRSDVNSGHQTFHGASCPA